MGQTASWVGEDVSATAAGARPGELPSNGNGVHREEEGDEGDEEERDEEEKGDEEEGDEGDDEEEDDEEEDDDDEGGRGFTNGIASYPPSPVSQRASPVPLLDFSVILGVNATTKKPTNHVRGDRVKVQSSQAGGPAARAQGAVRVAMVVSGSSHSLDVVQFCQQLKRAVDSDPTRTLHIMDDLIEADSVLAFHVYLPGGEAPLPTAEELNAFTRRVLAMNGPTRVFFLLVKFRSLEAQNQQGDRSVSRKQRVTIDLTSTAYASVVTNQLRVDEVVFPGRADKDQAIEGIQRIAQALKDEQWLLGAVPRRSK